MRLADIPVRPGPAAVRMIRLSRFIGATERTIGRDLVSRVEAPWLD